MQNRYLALAGWLSDPSKGLVNAKMQDQIGQIDVNEQLDMQTGEYSNTKELTNKQLIEQTKARNRGQEKKLDTIIDTVQELKLEVENQKTIGKRQLK